MTFILRDLFGDSPECRIMEVFVENPDCVFSEYEISQLADAAPGWVVYKHMTKLIHNEVVMLYGYDGNVATYKLNTNNIISKILSTLNDTMMSEWTFKLLESENTGA